MSTISLGFSAIGAALAAPLARLRRRLRVYLIVHGMVRLGVALIVCGLAQLLLDRWLRLSLDQRAALNALITLIWLGVIYRYLVLPLLQPLDDHTLATAVDRAHPRLHGHMATAVEFSTGRVGAAPANSPQLVHSVLQDWQSSATQVDVLAVLDHRGARRRLAELGAVVLAIGLAFAVQPAIMSTWFLRNWLLANLSWPQQTRLIPVGFDELGQRRWPRGEELEISARIEGKVPRRANLTWWTRSGAGGRLSLNRVGDTRFEGALGSFQEDVYFRIVGGDESTRDFCVAAVDRPHITHIRATITPPAYVGQDPLILEQQTTLPVLAGSALELVADLNKPVRTAEFVDADGPVAPSELSTPRQVRVRWDSPQSGSYRFELTDVDGLRDRQPVRLTIQLVSDQPPSVKLQAPAVGEFITPEAELALELEFQDTFGLASAALEVQKGELPPYSQTPARFAPGVREFQESSTLAVLPLGAAPGDRLRVWAQATDAAPVPNVGRSAPLDLRVVSREDFLAELARRELELRREFERLIGAQSVLRDELHRLGAEGAAGSRAARQAGLSRRQNAQASRCVWVAKQFEQLLAEMFTSKVARPPDERRIHDRIVEPLRELGLERMPAASAALAMPLAGDDPVALREQLETQDELLRAMKVVLANMLEWEGYREALALLAQIIAEQGEIRAATTQALSEQLDAILGDDEPPAPDAQEPP